MKNKFYFKPVVLGLSPDDDDEPLPGGSTGHGGDPIYEVPDNPLNPGEGSGDAEGGGSEDI